MKEEKVPKVKKERVNISKPRKEKSTKRRLSF